MISVAEAREIILDRARRSAGERVAITDALGRVLAEPIIATRAQPPFRASAMDGYALRSADTPGALRLIGEAGAGHALHSELRAGECARIFTGAPLPDGADAVLMQEDAERDGDIVQTLLVAAGKHVRAAGVDFIAGAELVEAGGVLDAAAIALAAAAGLADVIVARKPRIAVLGGGDELAPPGTTPGPAQIFDSASYGVSALASSWGAASWPQPPFADSQSSIAASLESALAQADLAIVIGGASVGDHDHARGAVSSIGAELLFEKVSLRPGKPTWFAARDGKLVLGLPGNPASAFVCARLFLRPLIAHLLGRSVQAAVATTRGRVRQPLGENGARETYLRAKGSSDENGQLWLDVAANQDSSLITVIAASDALVVRAPGAPALPAGALVETLAF
ncbi:MAG TPA: gephyrin-like molybdotransferase Glp [Vitreimonas sp.]|uniref:molybdopterin molybdotransferase MoeA n=1 Tax=Vitreimonas sp. TaxID=3069702 RepID=UPI002D744802|nr:gephyrin-like molybdotransferase Glp [Vitreimonas sp.]HYD89293.1 gephyrin-like molybdotransferase Glp [Vitreimonas sp.]